MPCLKPLVDVVLDLTLRPLISYISYGFASLDGEAIPVELPISTLIVLRTPLSEDRVIFVFPSFKADTIPRSVTSAISSFYEVHFHCSYAALIGLGLANIIHSSPTRITKSD